MALEFSVPTPEGGKTFTVQTGTSLYFVGANGGGKTRLAVHIETELGERCHRIAAHRALALNPSVAKVSEKDARTGLKYGNAGAGVQLLHRASSRWGGRAATQLLNDYDFLIQALFADQANTSLTSHKAARTGGQTIPEPTKFEKLAEIWDRLLPQRRLDITGDDVQVSPRSAEGPYSGSEMSDGERAVFYLLGQVLIAEPGILLIFDEPELHIHRAILSRLWDEIEAARPDCGMVAISHDLDFVAGRNGPKFVLREYARGPVWTIEAVPENSGFSEGLATLILGSRRPILFVEGRGESLDRSIYRACYPEWTIIPRGSSEEVVHAVVTMRANAALTRVTCAGIVDADDYSEQDMQNLTRCGVGVLPVSEIENLLLLPDVVEAIAKTEGLDGQALQDRCSQIADELFSHAARADNQRGSILRYCRRRIDRALKVVDLQNADNVEALISSYRTATESIDVQTLANTATASIQSAIETNDAAKLLRWYDNKGVLSIVCKVKGTSQKYFEQWVIRAMGGGKAPEVVATIRGHLPQLSAS